MAVRRTLARDISSEGIALHAGVAVRMRMLPAAAKAGIVFRRSDLPGSPSVRAKWQNVVDSRFATVIGENGVTIGVTEHLLSAFAGAEIDDCIVDLDGPEPPALGGDALSFMDLIDRAGVRETDIQREAIAVLRRVTAERGDASVSLTPSSEASYRFEIDFPENVIGHQAFECSFSEAIFRTEIAPARTFGFFDQAEQLRQAGFARGASFENTLVIGKDRLMNPDKQRFPDEFVRHKILDAIGDLKLAGAPLIGHFEGYRSSHSLNATLLRNLFSNPENFEISASP